MAIRSEWIPQIKESPELAEAVIRFIDKHHAHLDNNTFVSVHQAPSNRYRGVDQQLDLEIGVLAKQFRENELIPCFDKMYSSGECFHPKLAKQLPNVLPTVHVDNETTLKLLGIHKNTSESQGKGGRRLGVEIDVITAQCRLGW
eukprot:TRINITY_DN1190_c0_g1_i7.p1 TRINITY_DN1190_c0_g1~~TRINITY_DN1190_c0_g1_i7.p1  ORF type:complete len:144 (+),score=12.04 TRINITY_DN1190_c0_g1_i7:163-594(+)